MPTEPLALAIEPPEPPSEGDYRAFCAMLTQSERGRSLLAEYVRRSRRADTEALLTAIGRIEARLAADASAAQRLRDDLHVLLLAIRLARPEIDATNPATQAAKLKRLLDLLEQRLDAMAGAPAVAAAPPPAMPAVNARPKQAEETPRARLSVVPRPEQPELPIPSPAAQALPIQLVANAAALPEATVVEPTPPPAGEVARAPAAPAVPEADAPAAVVAAEAAAPPPAVPAGIMASGVAADTRSASPLPPADPLAAIMALSEDERLALFT